MSNKQKMEKFIVISLLFFLLWSRIFIINLRTIENNLPSYNITSVSHKIKSYLSPPFPFPMNNHLRYYIVCSPIIILSDEDWENYSFPGSGTADNPYLVEGYNITTNNPYGIMIKNTTRCFTIRHCFINGASESAIFVSNVSLSIVQIHNNILKSSVAISIEYCSQIRIVENNATGIFAISSEDIFISNNICSGVVWVMNSQKIIISSNYCLNDLWETGGIFVKQSSSVLIERNNVSSNELGGIYCQDSEYITVKENFCLNNTYHGGICFINVTRSSILDNICIDNKQENIKIRNCTTITITNNTSANTQRFHHWFGDIVGWGILITNDIDEDCSDIIIEQNECVNNTYGIALLHCNGTIIVRNNFVWNCYKAGIELYNLNNSAITYNTLFRNIYGVYIAYDIYYNTIEGYVERICYNNTVHHNNFIENNLNGSSQAYDAGINNTWYDPQTLEGNYWSDWNGTGVYAIDGPANSFDPYPLPSSVIYIPPSSYSLFHYWWFDLSLLLSSFILISSTFIAFRRLKIFQ
ncbi:MAG: NosD domain-containing protein [Candidatus Heimdallarchaeaceae archaeon]